MASSSSDPLNELMEDFLPHLDKYICRVCGVNPSRPYSSYGASACNACRVFFKRAVPKNGRFFECRRNLCQVSDVVTTPTRQSCSACRYQRCLDAGMKPTWTYPRNGDVQSGNPTSRPNLSIRLSKEEESVIQKLKDEFKMTLVKIKIDAIKHNKTIQVELMKVRIRQNYNRDLKIEFYLFFIFLCRLLEYPEWIKRLSLAKWNIYVGRCRNML